MLDLCLPELRAGERVLARDVRLRQASGPGAVSRRNPGTYMPPANPCVNVLILDEPTRNFSPISGPRVREALRAYEGTVISVSHDRKFLMEVCDKLYRFTENGLVLVEKEEIFV